MFHCDPVSKFRCPDFELAFHSDDGEKVCGDLVGVAVCEGYFERQFHVFLKGLDDDFGVDAASKGQVYLAHGA